MTSSLLPAGPSIALVCLLVGFLCRVARQYRPEPSLRLLEAGSFAGGVGILLVMMRPPVPEYVAIPIGNGILLLTLALFWQAAGRLAGRPLSRLGTSAPTLAWLACCVAPLFWQSLSVRVAVATVLVVALVLLAMRELARIPRETRSHQMLFVVGGAHIACSIGRAVMTALPSLAALRVFVTIATPFEVLIYAVLWPGLMLTMIAERSVLQARAAALQDDMTGVMNRRGFWLAAASVPRRGVLLFDIDHFKRINDTFGHASGDFVIRHFTSIAVGVLGVDTVFGRIGGEEFAAVTSGMSAAELAELGERVRAAFERMPLSPDLRATVSIGFSAPAAPGRPLGEQMAQADAALYRAKRRGRNCVEGDGGDEGGMDGAGAGPDHDRRKADDIAIGDFGNRVAGGRFAKRVRVGRRGSESGFPGARG